MSESLKKIVATTQQIKSITYWTQFVTIISIHTANEKKTTTKTHAPKKLLALKYFNSRF